MINKIRSETCRYFEIEDWQLDIRSKQRKIVFPRQIAHWFLRKYTNLSFRDISEAVGTGRGVADFSYMTIENLIETNDKDTIVAINVMKYNLRNEILDYIGSEIARHENIIQELMKRIK